MVENVPRYTEENQLVLIPNPWGHFTPQVNKKKAKYYAQAQILNLDPEAPARFTCVW